MTKLRIDPITATARFYRDSVDINAALSDMKEPYYKTVTLIFLDTGDVRLTACAELPDRVELRNLANKLSASGYKRITWRHDDQEHEFML